MKPVKYSIMVLILVFVLISRISIAFFLYPDGGYDLSIYTYFGRMILAGTNPYHAPINGPIPARYADMTPINLALFASLLSIFDHPLTIRIAFILAEYAAIVLLLFTWRRRFRTRALVCAFLAINPFTLRYWTASAEDKTITFLLLVMFFLALEYEHIWAVFIFSGMLAGYKFVGFYLIIPLVLGTHKNIRTTILQVVIFISIVVAAHLPYFPDCLVLYKYRAQRLAFQPMYQSPFILLAQVGCYEPVLAKVLPTLYLCIVYIAFIFRKLDLQATLALALLAVIFAPDIGLDRILMVVLPLIFLIGPRNKSYLIYHFPKWMVFKREPTSISKSVLHRTTDQ